MKNATDALANERTFLAYVRTALALIAFGFVIARFGLFVREIAAVTHAKATGAPHVSSAFGLFMALVGVAIGLLGGWRYSSTNRALERGEMRTLSSTGAYVVTIVIVAIGLVVADLLISYR
jgi:putative membrane protein